MRSLCNGAKAFRNAFAVTRLTAVNGDLICEAVC
jgi:hypothetical protein